jgi:Na+-translocating ferredoxin:NAD+ oxidoreductase subunit D
MKFTFRPSPNYHQPLSTQRIMMELTICIALVLGYNVAYYFLVVGAEYGWHALAMIATSLGTAIAIESLWAFFYAKKNVIKYLSTSFPAVTALLFVGMMGVNKPLYVIFVGSLVATLVGKLVFGGFGQNIFNPAGVGRAFSVLAFGGFIASQFPDVVTGATPNNVMESLGWVITKPEAVSAYLNQFNGVWGLFSGQYIGALGETNTLLIMAVGVYLSFRKIIDWRVPVVFIGSLFAFATIIMFAKGMDWWYPFFFISTGGAMFGAVFMLTDPVTSPTSIPGRIIFAIGVAFLTTLIRVKGNLPEGVIRSILFMNMMTPLIDRVMDGWPLKSMKKYAFSIGSVVLVSLLTVGFTTGAISYIEPYVPEEEKPTLGDPILFSSLGAEGLLNILNSTIDGDIITYTVEVDGFAVLEADWETDPKPNVLEIKINAASSTIVSVSFVTFSDSGQYEYKTNHPIFLNQFAGLSITVDNSVDVSVGATFTVDSVIRAVKAAITTALTPR